MAENYGTKIERKYMAHFINTEGDTAVWERLGKDLEEFDIELNPSVEETPNILGEVNIVISSYQAQANADPYYARKGTKLFDFLQDVIDNRKVLDDLKVETLEVHLWEDETSGAYHAFKEVAFIEPTSYGGNTTGYQIPFTLHYTGEREEGSYNPTTGTYTKKA